jgi:aspartyl-tRNA(Asn)/glutamyl-tRNA(Gln) amidotransferase subunit B
MAQGSMRCDVNVSVRKEGETELGTRAEIKISIHLSLLKKL